MVPRGLAQAQGDGRLGVFLGQAVRNEGLAAEAPQAAVQLAALRLVGAMQVNLHALPPGLLGQAAGDGRRADGSALGIT